MYKVSEVAEMLSVGKIKIVEALILHDLELAPYITKERHLTYISDQGVRKLELILFSKAPETPDETEALSEGLVEDEKASNLDQLDKFIEKTSKNMT